MMVNNGLYWAEFQYKLVCSTSQSVFKKPHILHTRD